MQQHQPIQIRPTDEEIQAFINSNPAVKQALENIVLTRMVRERDAEIARFKDGATAMAPIANMPKEEVANA